MSQLKTIAIYLLYMSMVGLIIQSCVDEDEITRESNEPRVKVESAIPTGVITWRETITDSTTLPLTMYSEADSIKKQYIMKNIAIWDVELSVPDPTQNYIKTIKTRIQMGVIDSTVPITEQVWKTEIYKNIYKEFSKTGSLIYTTALDMADISEDDFTTIPGFEFAIDTIVGSAEVTSFKNTLIANGQTVNDLGTTITSEIDFSEEGKNITAKAVFNKSYLIPDYYEIFYDGEVKSKVFHTYTIVSGGAVNLRMNTKRINVSYSKLDEAAIDEWVAYYPGFDLADYFSFEEVTVVEISNIVL